MHIVARIMLVECRTTEVHTSHSIANERMQTTVQSLSITSSLCEMHVLTCKNSLACSIVRIHTLPATRQGATMEYYEQTIVVGIAKNIFIKLNHWLLVATKEVNLDTTNTYLLHPFHVFLAGNSIVHDATRPLRSMIPSTI